MAFSPEAADIVEVCDSARDLLVVPGGRPAAETDYQNDTNNIEIMFAVIRRWMGKRGGWGWEGKIES